MGIFGEVLGGTKSHTFFLLPKAWEYISAMYQCFLTPYFPFSHPLMFPFDMHTPSADCFLFAFAFYHPVFGLLLLEIFDIIFLSI